MTWPRPDVAHWLVRCELMAALEQDWLASGLPVPSLMEKVGLAMAAWLLERPTWLNAGVLVLVGPGHNGGDGLVVARELAQAGVAVRLWLPLPIRASLTQQHLDHARWLGIPVLESVPDPADPALWIEALFGLGQSRPLPQALASLLRRRQQQRPHQLVSLDLPAGLDGDHGHALKGEAAVARATLTVALIKEGLVQDAALEHVGELHRIDAGWPDRLMPDPSTPLLLGVTPEDLQDLAWPQPPCSAMKYQRGRVLVIAGSDRYRGATLLALRGALASGVGSIQAVVPEAVAQTLWQVLPEVVLAGAAGPAAEAGRLWPEAVAALDLSRFDAVLLGPGLGPGSADWDRAAAPLLAFSGVLVLDADGLNQLAASPGGWRWLTQRQGPTWLTPHPAEFRRLFPTLALSSPVAAAREAASCSGAVLVLKGAHSVIAAPDGSARQLLHTDPHVARTGLGDVLAGFAAGWAAQRPAMTWGAEALAAAVALHAEAARRCRASSTAGDVAQALARLCRRQQRQAGRERFAGDFMRNPQFS